MSYTPNKDNMEELTYLSLGGTITGVLNDRCEILTEVGSFGNAGMKCDVTFGKKESVLSDCTIYVLVLDFRKHTDYNKDFESMNWYGSYGTGCSYADRCKGLGIPEKYHDIELYINDVNPLPFTVVMTPRHDKAKCIAAWLESDAKTNNVIYTDWLEQTVADMLDR